MTPGWQWQRGSGLRWPALACSGPPNGRALLRRRHGMRGQISPGVAGAGAVSFGPHVSEQLGSATRWE